MTGKQLRNSILQEAIHGRLVPNVLQPGEKTGEELFKDILAERQKKENAEKGKKAKKLTLSTIEEEPWELPEGWCWCKLPEMCEIRFGTRVVKKLDEGSTFFVYGGGGATFKVDSYNREDALLVSRFAMSKQCTRFVAGKFFLNDSGLSLHTYGSSVQQSYLNYVIFAFNDTIYQLGRGAAQKNLNMDEFEELLLPLPPLSIQKAIIAKIEELLPLIDEYDKAAVELETLNKTLPDKLRKSVFQEAIHGTLVPNDIPEGEATGAELLQQILKERQDKENKEKGKKAKKLTLSTIEEEPWELPEEWCWCKLKDIGYCETGTTPSKEHPEFFGGSTPFLSPGNIQNNVIVGDTIGISNEGLDYCRLVEANTILQVCIGGSIGKCAIVKERSAFNQQINSISPILCNYRYVFYVLQTDYFYLMMKAKATGTATPIINRGNWEQILFPLPPLTLQHRIVEKIDVIFAVIDKLQEY